MVKNIRKNGEILKDEQSMRIKRKQIKETTKETIPLVMHSKVKMGSYFHRQ
jgi:hypothetical protein